MSNSALVQTGLFSNSYRCENCGYTGTFFPEVEKSKIPQIKKIKSVEKRQRIDTTYGKNINWWWRKISPLIFFLSIIFLLFYNIPAIFYAGLIELLPLSIVLLLISYKTELIKKNKVLKFFIIIAFIYVFIIGPILFALFMS